MVLGVGISWEFETRTGGSQVCRRCTDEVASTARRDNVRARDGAGLGQNALRDERGQQIEERQQFTIQRWRDFARWRDFVPRRGIRRRRGSRVSADHTTMAGPAGAVVLLHW